MTNGPKLLREFLKARGKTLRDAAAEIGVSHPALLAWVERRSTPIGVWRQRIAEWSDSAIPVEAWKSARERRAVKAIARADRAAAKTGT